MSNRNFNLGIVVLGLMTSAISNGTARAADLAEPYVGSQQFSEDRVDFGSGWYIRGDIAAVKLPKMSLTNPTVPRTQSDGSFTPLSPTIAVGNASNYGYTASLGAGYQVNSWSRVDMIADYHQRLATGTSTTAGSVFCPTGVAYNSLNADGTTNFSLPSYANGACTGAYKARLNSYDVLLNGYIDIGTWNSITPYVGAGVGVSFGHYYTQSTYTQANSAPYQVSFSDAKYGSTFAYNYDRQSSGTYYNFAWALMAGAAIDVYPHTKLDIGYRYLNLGSIAGVSGTLATHEVRAGVRYMIDN